MTPGSRVGAQVVTGIVVAVFGVAIWASGGTVSSAWLRFFGAAAFTVWLALVVWDRWLWKVPFIQRVLPVPVDLTGTWKGSLHRLRGPDGDAVGPAEQEVYLVIRQTSTTISVVLLTAELTSKSTVASIRRDEASTSVSYVYFARPEARVESRSRMHNGAAILDVSGRPAARLDGRYWTDRDTRGQFEVSKRRKGTFDDFVSAQRAFGKRK
jgi:hypothetical protein